MPARLDSVELFSETIIDGIGARIAILAPLISCRTSRQINGQVATAKRTIVLPKTWDPLGDPSGYIAILAPTRVIHLVRTDGTFEEARITDVTRSSGADGRITVVAADMLLDLAKRCSLISDSSNGRVIYTVTKTDTVANLITYVLGFAYNGWFAGTVTPTNTITVTFTGMNPYEGLIAIAAAAFAASGTQYELSYRWDVAASQPKVDLTILNGAAAAADIRTGKNLGPLLRLSSGTNHGNRVVSLCNDGGGPGDNWWQVSAVSVNTYIRVIDINGGPSPLIGVAALTNRYVVDRLDGKHQITSDAVVSGLEAQLNMASTTNISVGDWIRIAADSAGSPVQYVDYPGIQTTGPALIKLQRPSISRTNWLLNPDLKNWTGTTPDSWTKTGAGVIAKDTTVGNYLTGGASAKLTSTSITLSQTRTVCIPTVGNWYANYVAWFKVDPTGTPGSSTFATYYDGGLTIPGGSIDLQTSADGQWHTAYTSWRPATGSHTFRIDVLLGRVMWMDAGDIYFTEGSALELPFIAGSGGAMSWLDAKAYILAFGSPPVQYSGKAADLFKAVPEDAPYDELLLGKTDNITDYEIGDTLSPRVVSLDEDELNPIDTSIGWSTRRPELSRLVTA